MDNETLQAMEKPGQAETSQAPAPGQAADVAWMEEKKRLIAERDEAKRKYRDYEKKFGEIEAAKKQAEIKAMEQAGEYQKAIEAREKQWSEKHGSLQSKFSKVAIDGAIIEAAAKMRAVNPGDAVLMIRGAFALDPETHEPVISDPDALRLLGVEPKNDKLQQKTLQDIVTEVLKSRPHMLAPAAPGGGAGVTASQNNQQAGISPNYWHDDDARKARIKQLEQEARSKG